MNDKCAAGTGRFLEVIVDALGFPLLVPPEPLITGALGAALIGKETYEKEAELGVSIRVPPESQITAALGAALSYLNDSS